MYVSHPYILVMTVHLPSHKDPSWTQSLKKDLGGNPLESSWNPGGNLV